MASIWGRSSSEQVKTTGEENRLTLEAYAACYSRAEYDSNFGNARLSRIAPMPQRMNRIAPFVRSNPKPAKGLVAVGP
jgi:hypothetical protein